MDHDIPLPPPGAIPLPPSDTPQLYSPSQNSPTAYSPSRATSPSSDTDDKSASASRKPGAVLGKGKAKSRLRAFMQSQISNSPKRRVASVFNEDDEEGTKKMRPVVKQATPVMDQLMKDELREKNKAIEIVQEANRKREDSLMEAERKRESIKREDDLRDANRKREEDLKKIQDNKDLDLREILKKKKEREVADKREEEREKRSRSRGKERSPDRKRGRRSPERRKSPELPKSPERRKSPDIKTPQPSGEKSKLSGEKEERRVSRRSRTPERGSRSGRSEDKRDRDDRKSSQSEDKRDRDDRKGSLSEDRRDRDDRKSSQSEDKRDRDDRKSSQSEDKRDRDDRKSSQSEDKRDRDDREDRKGDKDDRKGDRRSRTMEKQSGWPSLDNVSSVPRSWAGLKRNDIDVRNPEFRELMGRCGDKEEKILRECETVMVVMCTNEDFKEVKGVDRALPDGGHDVEKMEVPKKYIKATSDGVTFSFNKATNELQENRKYQQRYDFYEKMDKHEIDENEFENMRKILEGDKTPPQDLMDAESGIDDANNVAWYPEEKKWRLETQPTGAELRSRKLRSSVDDFVNELAMGAEDATRSVEKKSKKFSNPEITALKKQIKDLERETKKKKKEKKPKLENEDGTEKKAKKKKDKKEKKEKKKKKKEKREKKAKRDLEEEDQKVADESLELPLNADIFADEQLSKKRSRSKGDGYDLDSPSPPKPKLDNQQAKLLSMAGYGAEPLDNQRSPKKRREGSLSPKRSRKSRKLSPVEGLASLADIRKAIEQKRLSPSPSRNKSDSRMSDGKEKKQTEQSRDLSPVDKHIRSFDDKNLESPKKKEITPSSKQKDHSLEYENRPASHNSRSEDILATCHADLLVPAGASDMSDSIDTSFGTPVRDEGRALKEEATKRSSLAESPRPSSRSKRSLSPARPGGRGPRTPSPSPRLPKMTDRRSPSTSIAPVMRDQRSPVRRQGSPGWRNDSYSGEERHAPARPQSPGGRAILGKSPAGSRDGHSPRKSPGRARRGLSPGDKRSPGISPGYRGSPGRSIASKSPVKPTLNRSPGRSVNRSPGRAHTPPGRSPSTGSRKRSPGRPYTPERRIPSSPGRGYRSPSPRGARRFSPGRKSPSPGRRPHSPGRRPPSPGKRPHSPGRRPPSPGRRPLSPGRRPLSPGRRPLSPGRRPLSPGMRSMSPGRRSPGRRRSPSPPFRRRSPRRGGRSPSPYSRRFRSPSPGGRRYSPSRRRAPPSPGRGHMSPGRPMSPGRRPLSPGRRPLSPGRRPLSPGRRPLSPGRRSPGRRPGSPGRRPLSPGRRPLSPGRRPLSPGRRPMSPGRRPMSPGRRPMSPGRRPLSPGRPGWRPPSPGRRLSPGRRHSPGRRPISPGRRAPSPGRRGISPRGRPYSPDKRPPSPGQGCPADSTISDADLATQMLPPSAAHHRSSHYHTTHADSPKRPSLDERLERELGIKVAREEPSMPDFRVPPPGFPGVAKAGGAPFPAFGHPGAPQGIPPGQTPPRYGLPAAPGMAPALGATPPARPGANLHVPAVAAQPQAASPKVTLSTGLPAKIPTYNDTHPDKAESKDSRPPYPGTRSEQVAQEREQASKAAESVAAKLQEMQAAKEEERRKKREARMAERMAMMEPATEVKEEKIDPKVSKVASGPSILEALEKKEVEVKMDEDIRKKEEQAMKRESVDFETPAKEKRSKKKGDPDTPTLITLKPFYRPESKKEKKKTKRVSPPAPTFPESPEEEEEEEFVKKEPVPLPDNSLCKPVLVKLGFPIARDQNGFAAAPRDKKLVKFVDGVLPGQGSPDISTDSPSAVEPIEPEKEKTPTKKKWKKVRITVVTRVTGDTDSEDESPPPPPPGSPPRYHTSQLIQMYGKPRLMTPTKA